MLSFFFCHVKIMLRNMTAGKTSCQTIGPFPQHFISDNSSNPTFCNCIYKLCWYRYTIVSQTPTPTLSPTRVPPHCLANSPCILHRSFLRRYSVFCTDGCGVKPENPFMEFCPTKRYLLSAQHLQNFLHTTLESENYV